MPEFTHKGKPYIADLAEPYDIKKSLLTITNSTGDKLIIDPKNKFVAHRCGSTGESIPVDLIDPKHKDFYQSLVRNAYDAVQKWIKEQEKVFVKAIEAKCENLVQDFDKTLNIAIIGNVSCGKSSLINAFLMRNRNNQVAKVGVQAGVTQKIQVYRLDDKVRLIDSPGLGDIRAENSEVTRKFIENIDVGILVVSGAADASQKIFFDDLKRSCDSVFVVLSKIDVWDKFEGQALEDVINQWKKYLRVDQIYPVCTFGYDPQISGSIPLDIRGVDELREDIEIFLEDRGKKLLLARHMSQKRKYALGIILSAVTAVGVQAALPGKAAWIVATQSTAIISLYYLYKGKRLTPTAIVALLPVFAGEAVATNVFLFFASFIPPTGVVELAAAITAMSITGAMLASVNFVLSDGLDLDNKQALKIKFKEYKKKMDAALKKIALTDVRNLGSIDFQSIINELL